MVTCDDATPSAARTSAREAPSFTFAKSSGVNGGGATTTGAAGTGAGTSGAANTGLSRTADATDRRGPQPRVRGCSAHKPARYTARRLLCKQNTPSCPNRTAGIVAGIAGKRLRKTGSSYWISAAKLSSAYVHALRKSGICYRFLCRAILGRMRIVLLGAGEAFDETLGNTSALVLNESTVLLDCGYAAPFQVWRYNPSPSLIDAI